MTEIIEYNKTESALAELRQSYAGVQFEVTNPQGMQAAKVARNTIRTIRTDLEKMRKQIKAPALERSRLIDAEAARITAELVALEKPIEEQIKAEERREQEEREAKERAHKARIDAIKAKLDFIAGSVGKAFGKPSLEISAILAGIISYDIKTKGFDEFEEEAEKAKANAIADLKILLAGTEAMERQQVAMQEMEAKQKALEAREEALRQQEDAIRQQEEIQQKMREIIPPSFENSLKEAYQEAQVFPAAAITTERHGHNIEQHLSNLQPEFAEVPETVEADFEEVEESSHKQEACVQIGRKGLDLIAEQEKIEQHKQSVAASLDANASPGMIERKAFDAYLGPQKCLQKMGRMIKDFGAEEITLTYDHNKVIYTVEIYLQ